MADNQDALTTEGVFEKYAAFSGVQGFEFADTINTFSSSKWSAYTGVAFGSTMNRTVAFVTDGITWYADSMPHSYLMTFTYHEPIWSAVLRGDGTSSNYYRLDYDATSNVVTLIKVSSGNTAVLFDKILAGQEIAAWGKAKIAVRDAQFTSDSQGRILYISLWINDNLVVSIADNVTTGTPPLRMGFLIHTGAVATLFSNIRVANLGEIITISSLDPGEKPIGAIQRAIEDRYIRFWVRWDGKLKAWAPKARASTTTISRSKEFVLSLVTDIRQVITHIRVLGAFQWVRVFDSNLMRRFGNRFRELQNTSTWNADDCYNIGLQLLIRSNEQAFQAQFSSFGLVLLEIEDRIKLPDVTDDAAYIDYIIDNINWRYENGTLQVSGGVRQYFYGEP